MSALFQKILELQTEISYVKKDSKNAHFKYNYVSESALIEKVMAKVNEKGLIVLPSLTSLTCEDIGGKPSATVTYEYRVIDASTGDEVVLSAGGFEQGDKCAFKAMTGANKYFFLRFLQIATGDDPEKDEKPMQSVSSGNRTRPMPERETVAPGHKEICRKNFGMITEIMQFNHWDESVLQAETGLSKKDLSDLFNASNEPAAVDLGAAYMKLKGREQREARERKGA